MYGLDELVDYFYSCGDVFECNIKLILVFMFLQFALSCVSLIRDGMKASK